MKKHYTLLHLWLLVFSACLMCVTGMQAQVSFSENFDYSAGDLSVESGGKWMRVNSYSDSPIQVVDEELALDGCPLSGTKSVQLINSNGNECLMTLFDYTDRGVAEGSVYYALLVKVAQAPSKMTHFVSLVNRTMAMDVQEGRAPGENGRVFVGPGSTDDTFRFGVNLGSGTPKAVSGDYELGSTHLIVARVDIGVSNGKDRVTLFVDPASYTEEPSESVGSNESYGVSNGYGYKAIELSQQLSYGESAGKLTVSALRVADSYAGLFAGSEENKPELTATGATFQYAFVGVSYEGEINVKGKNLKGDVTLACDNADVTFEQTTIPAADVLGENGATVKFTLLPSSADDESVTANVTLTTEGGEAQTATILWAPVPTRTIEKVKDFAAVDAEGYEYLLFKGQAVVSYVDKSTSPTTFYLQDADGGVVFKDSYGVMSNMLFDEGDSIGNFVVMVESMMGVNGILPVVDQNIRIVNSHNTVKAVTATIDEIKAAPMNYINRLVRIRKVTLSGFDEGAAFAEGMTQPTYTDANSSTGKVRIFKGTDLIGNTIPTEQIDLIGLLTSKAVTNGPIVAPRHMSDLAEPAAPSLSLSADKFLEARGKVGESTVIGTVHVTSAFQESEITIVPSGAVENIYSTSVQSIPAGDNELDIEISYTPTKVGKDNGYLYFMQNDDILATIRVNGMAIDPANPPALEISPSSFETFTAAAGEQVKQTISVTPIGMPDYVKVRLEQGNSVFTSSTSLLATSGTQQVSVTFTPADEGNYEATLTFYNDFIDPVVLTLTGVATAAAPEPEPEGDDFSLSTENPLKLLNETFTSGTHNTPLSLEGWKNVAVLGTRAWWGYTFPDYNTENAGEKVAKVTGYDSEIAEGSEEESEMLLITPALDFENSASKIFTFRVMGENLTDDMTDKLMLCYIYISNGQAVAMPLSEVVMPASKDENGEWVDYQVDLTGQDIDPTFFMGFYFMTSRGRQNSAVYYIDDVTYGRTDLALITPKSAELTFDAKPNTEATMQAEVAADNLTEGVKLSLTGTDKDLFELSTTELPAQGGTFTVKFKGAAEGQYEAQVKLTSRGAAAKYITLTATSQTGINAISADQSASIAVFDAAGRSILRTNGISADSDLKQLPAGTYVIRVTKADGSSHTLKITK